MTDNRSGQSGPWYVHLDHLDGALAAEFVSVFKSVVEDPLSLML